MKLTANLKNWLVENCDVKADATDDEFKTAAGEALAKGTLAADKLVELTADPEAAEADAFNKRMTGIEEGLSNLNDLLAGQKNVEADAEAVKKAADEKAATEKAEAEAKAKAELENKGVESDDWHKALTSHLTSDAKGNEGSIRVKGAWEQYDTTTKSLTYPERTKSGRPHPHAGRPVMNYNERGSVINESSERDMAVIGAFSKFLCAKAQKGGSSQFGYQSLPGHDKELLHFAMEKMNWGGSSVGDDYEDISHRKLTPNEQKALIDDATSGGLEAAPIVFDDNVIQTPLLHGELFPLVNVVPLERGRRVEGVSTGTVTGSWGGVDDTAISLFNTASYVAAFDTTIFRWEGAIRIGLDFLSDTPINFAQHITSQYGERLLEDLDDVIADGNGTTQPEGIMQKTGITSISFGGTTSLGNYESLRFGVAKPEHRANVKASAVFCGNETSYQRARAIPVGAADARRLGGMDYDSYSWMERPYKINESLANTEVFYAVLARYRMHRRRGLTMRSSTEGDTLLRNNEMLMVAMARYGGQLERGAAGAITTDAPA